MEKLKREVALRKVKEKEIKNIPILAFKYDPRLPPTQTIQAKHWRSMTGQDPYLAEIFPQAPSQHSESKITHKIY